MVLIRGVIEKFKAFFEKYFGIGGPARFIEPTEPPERMLYEIKEQPLLKVAETKVDKSEYK